MQAIKASLVELNAERGRLEARLCHAIQGEVAAFRESTGVTVVEIAVYVDTIESFMRRESAVSHVRVKLDIEGVS
jgi:hypothetical protein